MSMAIPSANALYVDNIRTKLRTLFLKYCKELNSNNIEAKNTEKKICSNINTILEHACFEFVTILSVEQITTILSQIDFQTVRDYEILIPRLIKSSCQNKQFDAFQIVSCINFSGLNFDMNTCMDCLSYFNSISSFTSKITQMYDHMREIPSTDIKFYKEENTELKQQIDELKQEIKEIKLIKGSYFTPIRKRPDNFQSNIFKAIADGDLRSVQYLYERKHVDIEVRDSNGNTPLLYAVSRGRKYITRYLIENVSANIHARNMHGRSLLHLAAANGRRNILEHLLDSYGMKSFINDKDSYGNTPLHRAAYFGKSVPTIELLLEKNADKYKKNSKGQTPYDVTCSGNIHNPNYFPIKELLKF